jgi:hypothetical protein
MSKYLKCCNRIINVAHISHIHFDQAAERYSIHLLTATHAGFLMLGTGSINGDAHQLFATKKDHPEGYKVIEKWFNSIECVTNEKK